MWSRLAAVTRNLRSAVLYDLQVIDDTFYAGGPPRQPLDPFLPLGGVDRAGEVDGAAIGVHIDPCEIRRLVGHELRLHGRGDGGVVHVSPGAQAGERLTSGEESQSHEQDYERIERPPHTVSLLPCPCDLRANLFNHRLSF